MESRSHSLLYNYCIHVRVGFVPPGIVSALWSSNRRITLTGPNRHACSMPKVSPVPAPAFPAKFDEAKIKGVPNDVNITFEYVVKAPKKYVFEAWNIMADKPGGTVTPVTEGNPVTGVGPWPAVANDMERLRTERNAPLTVKEIIGNVTCPEKGDWHMEWKAGAPYAPWPCPMVWCCMGGAHGAATFVDGPGENETTVQVRNKVYLSGCCPKAVAKMAMKETISSITKPAEKWYKAGQHIGPLSMARDAEAPTE